MLGRRYVIAGIVIAAATLAVALIMLLGTVPHLASMAGAPIFDMRICGYTIEQAGAYLKALGPAGTAYYINVQQRLDLFLPALLFLNGAAWMLYFARRPGHQAFALPVPVLTAMLLVGFGYMITDYAENASIRAMLDMGAQGLEADKVKFASTLTTTKYLLGIVFYLILLIVMAVYVFRNRARR